MKSPCVYPKGFALLFYDSTADDVMAKFDCDIFVKILGYIIDGWFGSS